MKKKFIVNAGQAQGWPLRALKCRAITRYILYIMAFLCVNYYPAQSQELRNRIPAVSQGQRIEQDFGLGTISVKYYRPNTKGRKIFNETEPYGIVWRTGANNATVITITDTIQVEGHTLLPGAYSLFSIPGANEWTIIFNKNISQWGTYAYDAKQDLLRFKVKPVKLAARVETLSIQFTNVQEDNCTLQLLWENTGINLRLTTDVDKRIMANIIEAMKTDDKPYYMSAIWYYNHGLDLKQALAWMQEADKAQPPAFNIKYWLARIQLKTGDKKSAIISANEGLKLAMVQNSPEYIRMNKEILHEAGAN